VFTTSDVTFNDVSISNPANIYNLSHDSFADYVANEHIDWTGASSNFSTSGTGYFGGSLNLGVGLTTPAFTMGTGAGANKVFTSDASGNASWSDITSIGVGGSGTTNFLPKWTAGTTLGDSVLYESGGNIGIGTTVTSAARITLADHTTATGGIRFRTAATAVDLYSRASAVLTTAANFEAGSYRVGATEVISSGRIIKAADGTASAPAFSFSADTNTGMYRGGTDILRLATAGADRLTILANGSVGIGTTNPGSYKLNVAGNSYIGGTLTTTGAISAPTSTNTINNLVINSGTITSGTWQATAIGATYGGTGQTAYSTGDLLYASSTSALSRRGIGATGQVLTVSGGVPVWASVGEAGSVSFGNITSGTNTQAAMVVGTGASLNYTGSGTINASSLQGGTWGAPLGIGTTTPNTGAFTALSATGNLGVGGTVTFSSLTANRFVTTGSGGTLGTS